MTMTARAAGIGARARANANAKGGRGKGGAGRSEPRRGVGTKAASSRTRVFEERRDIARTAQTRTAPPRAALACLLTLNCASSRCSPLQDCTMLSPALSAVCKISRAGIAAP